MLQRAWRPRDQISYSMDSVSKQPSVKKHSIKIREGAHSRGIYICIILAKHFLLQFSLAHYLLTAYWSDPNDRSQQARYFVFDLSSLLVEIFMQQFLSIFHDKIKSSSNTQDISHDKIKSPLPHSVHHLPFNHFHPPIPQPPLVTFTNFNPLKSYPGIIIVFGFPKLFLTSRVKIFLVMFLHFKLLPLLARDDVESLIPNSGVILDVIFMSFLYPSNNDVAFKITIGLVIDY
jgi:hypothetical protein